MGSEMCIRDRSEKTVICATNGHDGFPHLMPLWYVVREDTLWAWTYAKSQKAKNLERDPSPTAARISAWVSPTTMPTDRMPASAIASMP